MALVSRSQATRTRIEDPKRPFVNKLNPQRPPINLLKVTGIPTTLLVDQKGREIGRTIGPAEWDSPDAVKLIRGYLEKPSVPTDASEDQRASTVPPS